MFHLVKTLTKTATRKLAEEHVSMKPFPGDRPLNPARMKYLRAEIEAGRFHLCDWASIACMETGETYRVNGKHTSHLLFDPSVRIEGIRVVIAFYKCLTLLDAAECYQTFDDSACSRTAGDVNRSVAGCIPAITGYPNWLNSLCVSGMSFSIFGPQYSTGKRGGKKERAMLLVSNTEFCHFVRGIMRGGVEKTKGFRRGPVVAVMYESFQEDPVLAGQFWSAVRDGTGSDPASADRSLQLYLMQKTCNHGGGAVGGVTQQRHVSRPVMYAKCMKAWTKWRDAAIVAREIAAT